MGMSLIFSTYVGKYLPLHHILLFAAVNRKFIIRFSTWLKLITIEYFINNSKNKFLYAREATNSENITH